METFPIPFTLYFLVWGLDKMESGRISSIPIYGYMDNWCHFSQGFFIFYYLLLFALLKERLYVRIDADFVIGAILSSYCDHFFSSH